MDGKLVSDTLQTEVQKKVHAFTQRTGFPPGLSVVLVGDHSASQVYVDHKIKASKKAGIRSELLKLSKNTKLEELKNCLISLNQDSKVHGILVQLPLPPHLDPKTALSYISSKKDVDGLTPENIGRLWSSQEGPQPCTPAGIVKLLEYYDIPIEGKSAVIIGRSAIVGRPMAQLLLEKNMTVTICHSKTKNLEDHTKRADVVISACGKHHLLKAHHFKKGAVAIDVGIHRISKNKKKILEGDICPDGLENVLSYLSPVPGGVGPMTIALLLQNTLKLAEQQSLS